MEKERERTGKTLYYFKQMTKAVGFDHSYQVYNA